jgi:gluconolactonase
MNIDRRRVLAGASGLVAVNTMSDAFAAWEPSLRYPDPAIRALDPSFTRYMLFNAGVERLATGFRWVEGPVYFGDGRYLIFSDPGSETVMKWEEESGHVTVFRKPSHHTNGNTRDRQGRLISCEHSTRRLTRTEYDGSITVLIDKFDGKLLNAPNDVVVKSDDSIWFSDALARPGSFYSGYTDKPELPFRMYRLDPRSGQAAVATDNVPRPNGLCFSPDESKLYVIDSGLAPRLIHVFDVVDGNKLTNQRPFFTCEQSETPDGLRCDIHGNLWCGWGMSPTLDGVLVLNPAGKRIGFIALPERCANLCFGGRHRNRLFMAASHSIYSCYFHTQGVRGG